MKVQHNYYSEALEMCFAEAGQTHQFFFDSADIVNIIRGSQAYYNGSGSFNAYEFNALKSLVVCLAWGGFLNNGLSKNSRSIQMTPTHQAEVFRLFQNDFGVYYDKDLTTEQLISNFVAQVEYIENQIPDTKDSLIKLNNLIEKGKHGYKIIQNLSPLSWNQRYRELRNIQTKRFELVDYNFDDFKIGDDEYFQSYLSVIKKLKKGRLQKNAFSDALALTYMARLAEKYNQSRINSIPVFFDSSEFKEALEESGLIEQFNIKLPNGSTQCILRNSYYFLAYSVVNFSRVTIIPQHQNNDKLWKAVIENTNTLTSFRDRLANKETNATLQSDYFLKLEQEIETYLTYEFCRKRLVPFFAEESLNKIKEDILDNKNVKSIIDELRSLDQQELNIQFRKQEILLTAHLSKLKIWDTIEQKIQQFELLKENMDGSLDVFNDFGLIRFFIPIEYHKDIINLLDDRNGIFSFDERTSFLQAQKIYDYYVEFSSEENNRKLLNVEQTRKLYSLLCVFWTLGLYEEIYTKILRDRTEYSVFGADHPLLMIKASSLLKIGNAHNRDQSLNKIINRLENQFNSEEHQQTKYEIAVMLAYINFNNSSVEQKFSHISVPLTLGEQGITLKKAIDFAQQAYEYYKNTRIEAFSARLYSTNILIYYIVEAGTDDQLDTIIDLFRQFAALEANAADLWHFRYDDTLARFFYRLSKREKYTIDRRKEFISRAREKTNYALSRWANVNPNVLRKINGCMDVLSIRNFRDNTLALDSLDF